MLSLLAGIVLAQARPNVRVDLPEPGGGDTLAMVYVLGEAIDPPKQSPHTFPGTSGPVRWEFPWGVAGLGRKSAQDQQIDRRIQVFSQERRTENDLAPMVARMGIRMWQMTTRRLKLDHPRAYRAGTVDFYLCWGGKPGGEHRYGEEPDPNGGAPIKVNVIYIYDLKSFESPVEMAREVAHEYGHAVIPAAGGYDAPEDWANGYLGERLYLRWFRDAMAAKRMAPEDAMGATFTGLDIWVKQNVDPLVRSAVANPPNMALLKGRTKAAMDAYHGLVLAADTLMPGDLVGRSLELTGFDNNGRTPHGSDYPRALVQAVMERDQVKLTIPTTLKGRPLWVPLRKGRVSGAKALKRQGDWVQIQPEGASVTLLPAVQ